VKHGPCCSSTGYLGTGYLGTGSPCPGYCSACTRCSGTRCSGTGTCGSPHACVCLGGQASRASHQTGGIGPAARAACEVGEYSTGFMGKVDNAIRQSRVGAVSWSHTIGECASASGCAGRSLHRC
jgi:hypothetical protein